MPTITVRSTYRKAATTLRPQQSTDAAGRECLRITGKAFRAAEQRCAYAGVDAIDFESLPVVDGYGNWQPLQCGDYIARKL